MTALANLMNELYSGSFESEEVEIDELEIAVLSVEALRENLDSYYGTLDVMQASFEALVADEITLESYNVYVGKIDASLRSAGIHVPAEAIAPSFESFSDYSTEAEEKKDNVIVRFIKAIWEKLKALGKALKAYWDKLFGKADKGEKDAKAEIAEVKEALKETSSDIHRAVRDEVIEFTAPKCFSIDAEGTVVNEINATALKAGLDTIKKLVDDVVKDTDHFVRLPLDSYKEKDAGAFKELSNKDIKLNSDYTKAIKQYATGKKKYKLTVAQIDANMKVFEGVVSGLSMAKMLSGRINASRALIDKEYKRLVDAANGVIVDKSLKDLPSTTKRKAGGAMTNKAQAMQTLHRDLSKVESILSVHLDAIVNAGTAVASIRNAYKAKIAEFENTQGTQVAKNKRDKNYEADMDKAAAKAGIEKVKEEKTKAEKKEKESSHTLSRPSGR